MATRVQGGGQTAYSNTDWDAYNKTRPQYPRSFIDIIYDYRQNQLNAGWDLIVDLGAGNGIATTHFAGDFKTLHLSDPSPSNISKCTEFLTDYVLQHGLNATVETSMSTATEAYKHVGNADLVICSAAAHWIDGDGLAASAAHILRPGGTLAVFTYFGPTICGSSRLQEALKKATGSMIVRLRKDRTSELAKPLNLYIQNVTTGNGGYDFMPMPDRFFHDKERVMINSANGEILSNGRLKKYYTIPGDKPGVSRVMRNEKIIALETGKDPEADGWAREVDKQFFLNFIDSMRPSGSPISHTEFKELCAEFETVFDEECPSGKVDIVFPAQLLLATRN